MEFVKYKEILAKVLSNDTYSLQIHSQEPETFTHLNLYVSKKDVSIVDKVVHQNFEEFINNLDSEKFFLKMVEDLVMFDDHNQLIRVLTSKALERASELNIWIDDLHDADYKIIISDIIKKNQV